MNDTDLLDTTGNVLADRVAQGLIALFEAVFPARIAGYFVEGSFASQTAIATSDLDLIVVFKSRWLEATERAMATRLSAVCQALSQLELDILITDEAALQDGADPLFKLGTRCLYGCDVRAAIPLLPIAQWARQRMHAAYWLIINVFQRPRPVRPPLGYPDPTARFYGYGQRAIRLPDGQEQPSTRDLVRIVGWTATALIAHRAQRYVVSKRDCAQAYRECINDVWADLIEQTLTTCRGQWKYHIPTEARNISILRSICERTLAFENYFLTIYRQFLLDELNRRDEAAQQEALRVLGHTCYADPEIIRSVAQLGAHERVEIRRAAASVLAALQPHGAL